MASGPHFMTNRREKVEAMTDFIFLGPKVTVDGDCSHEVNRRFLLGMKASRNLDNIFEKQRHHSADNGMYNQSYSFLSSHVRIWELDHKEGWVKKNWCFWTVVLEETLENPLDNEIKPVNPKGNQPWIFIGRTSAEAEAPILWPRDAKDKLIRKDSDAGKNWRQKEKGVAEDEMVR